MHVLLVQIHVKPECLEEFKKATADNVAHSLKEPGVATFAFCQQQDDPERFILFEAYRSPEDHARHRESAHYKAWREAVASMMAEPRAGSRYNSLLPTDSAW